MMPRGLHMMLATGGTGGHVMPALAVAQELLARNHTVSMMIDERGAAFVGDDSGIRRYQIRSATLSRGSLLKRLFTPIEIAVGVSEARRLIKRDEPAAMLGFGGYPALPAVLAANLLKLPTILHEQNAVLGRVNRLIAKRARVLALSYPETSHIPKRALERTVVTGNPVRAEIAALARTAYVPPQADGPIFVLVLGGSQGATILSNIVPDGLALLPPAIRSRLVVYHQARPADVGDADTKYRRADIEAEVRPYYEDMPHRLGKAHLVIARAGASTVAEISVAGRPSILVPFAAAMDDHQKANARDIVEVGGAILLEEKDFTPGALAKKLHNLLSKSDSLARASRSARSVAQPEAARRLADLMEDMVGARSAGGAV